MLRIVTFESEPRLAALLISALDPAKYEVSSAPSGMTSPGVLRYTRHALAVLDVSAAGAAPEVAQHFSDQTPWIAVDSEFRRAAEIACLEAGAQCYLTRDELSADTIRESVEAALVRGDRRRRLARLPETAPASESGRQSRRILLALADPVERAELTEIFEAMQYTVVGVPDSFDVLRMMGDFIPDILLLDDAPGKATGLETLALLQRDYNMSATAVFLVVNDYRDEWVRSALLMGVAEIIRRPYHRAELCLRIGNLLDLRHQEAELGALNDQLEVEKKSLTRYFSDEFVEDLLAGRIAADLGGELRDAAMLFWGLHNAETLVHSMDPQAISETLSALYHDVIDLVFASGGSVNKLMGDGLLATFGVPRRTDRDCEQALECARRIGQYMEMVQDGVALNLSAPLEYGIGIAYGRVFAGNLGSFRRMEYSVIGDPVNLASRLRSLTHSTGALILVNGALRDRLPANADLRRIETSRIRGKLEAVEIFEASVR
jgi:adenylate cyclase